LKPISVVVPVHNAAGTLMKVIPPLLAELQPHDQIIAVDDRSADGSRELLASMGVAVIESKGRPGAAGTRNTGGFAATGNWILFVDSDAVVPSGWRESLEARTENSDAVQGVYSRKAAGRSAATCYKNYYYFHTFTRRIKGPYIKGCGTFFFAVKRLAFTELNGFDENIAGATIEDADFSERLWAKGGRIAIAPEIQVFHLREYRTSELFAYEWNMMRAKALYILRRDRSRGAPSVSVAGFREMFAVLSGAFLSWLFVAGILLAVWGSSAGIYVALGGLTALSALQLPLVFHMIRDCGFRGLISCSFILPDLLLILPACVSALLRFATGKKY
jgi:GT2 family glycosyltransferase